jgi:endoglucanase
LKEHNGYGFLRVTKVGGVDIRHLFAQRVIIHGRRDLPGVLASLPIRYLPADRQNTPFGYEDLVVDPGLPFSTVQELVEIGDFISFHQPLRKLMGKNIAGKALDNRASIAAVTTCLDYLSSRFHEWDVIAAATAQEETRLLGAYTSAYSLNPDAAIAIDVTFAKGAAYSDVSAVELDSGPVLEIGPNIHPGIYKALRDAAEALEMDVSVSTHSRGSGTDAIALQVARSGIPTGLVSIPLRYMHTMVETVNTRDIKRTGRLLAEFITRLDGNFLTDLSKALMDED